MLGDVEYKEYIRTSIEKYNSTIGAHIDVSKEDKVQDKRNSIIEKVGLIHPSPFSSIHEGMMEMMEQCRREDDKKVCPMKLHVSEESVMGGMYGLYNNTPSFDYKCNPAGSDGEILACDMVRKMVGLPVDYSLLSNGLGKMYACFNEILLLCYHTSLYNIQDTSKQVCYIDDESSKKALMIRNCENIRQVQYKKGKFPVSIDIHGVVEQVKRDVEEGLNPHFFVYKVFNIQDVSSEEFRSNISTLQSHNIHILLDLSPLGIQTLREGLLSDIKGIEYVHIDVSKLTHTSSNILYMLDRHVYKHNIMNSNSMTVLEKYSNVSYDNSMITDNDYSSYHYIVGFGNYVQWYRLLFLLVGKGKAGLRKMVEMQKNNSILMYNSIMSKYGHLIASCCSSYNCIFIRFDWKFNIDQSVYDVMHDGVVVLYVPIHTIDHNYIERVISRIHTSIRT